MELSEREQSIWNDGHAAGQRIARAALRRARAETQQYAEACDGLVLMIAAIERLADDGEHCLICRKADGWSISDGKIVRSGDSLGAALRAHVDISASDLAPKCRPPERPAKLKRRRKRRR